VRDRETDSSSFAMRKVRQSGRKKKRVCILQNGESRSDYTFVLTNSKQEVVVKEREGEEAREAREMRERERDRRNEQGPTGTPNGREQQNAAQSRNKKTLSLPAWLCRRRTTQSEPCHVTCVTSASPNTHQNNNTLPHTRIHGSGAVNIY